MMVGFESGVSTSQHNGALRIFICFRFGWFLRHTIMACICVLWLLCLFGYIRDAKHSLTRDDERMIGTCNYSQFSNGRERNTQLVGAVVPFLCPSINISTRLESLLRQ